MSDLKTAVTATAVATCPVCGNSPPTALCGYVAPTRKTAVTEPRWEYENGNLYRDGVNVFHFNLTDEQAAQIAKLVADGNAARSAPSPMTPAPEVLALADEIAELHYNRVRDRMTKLHGKPFMPAWADVSEEVRQPQIEDAKAIVTALRSAAARDDAEVREALLERTLSQYDKTIDHAKEDQALSDSGRERIINDCLSAKASIRAFAAALLDKGPAAQTIDSSDCATTPGTMMPAKHFRPAAQHQCEVQSERDLRVEGLRLWQRARLETADFDLRTIVKLERALAPFARISLTHDTDPSGPDMIEGPDLAITPNEVRKARAALSVVHETAKGRDWQPIETAPRDGTRLILAWDDSTSLPMHWEVGRYRSGTGPGSGWCNTYSHSFGGDPTHWMRPATSALPSAKLGGGDAE